ncbi:hypothetical protein K504DRAFT_458203 [Pleomassaria siparia CBS 279.74]|uniref:Uncharacterized protein n=1 Tax=Pleomassaria siparia CBS 279.74 TaxID=1314801 RepID=A0A6G1K4J3_9PLEO|nr:hypothetical protein K504DRAFT_458203 [Pleomassaria siparia CBS 279.74]
MTAQHIPPPNARELLPPLLACLSTAPASKAPPPALIPLLSPILRQRLQLLASDNWLPLLCWDKQAASKLPQILGNIQLEPHPVSGEIELEDPDQILYRRSDPETLHARLVLTEFGLIPTYLWCTGGENGNRWELAELRGAGDAEDGSIWYANMGEANEKGFRRTASGTNGVAPQTHTTTVDASQPEPAQQDEDDDDAYWAAYDNTPAQTPKSKRSPAPNQNSRVQLPTQSELEYFARYAAEVQPALDSHDPDEEGLAPGESTLNGNSLNIHRAPQVEPLETSNLGPNGYDSSLPPASIADTANGLSHLKEIRKDSLGLDNQISDPPLETNKSPDRFATLNHPRPSSSASSGSVEKLERQATSNSNAELAIKQHISTDMKSLFRLARTAGIEREEFERIIMRELEVLPLLEQDN